ncbi:hypothetical protein AVEN_950-1 [Araneus ventricosus]|uniref:Uncharacterized protein n=1 Tax=Araneus ventricosus TaxID=182803 RepID=A0A4Y2CWH3_ARAVE|nr:hypothetical protein AVEN_950-1 [Araneus ventricosus]
MTPYTLNPMGKPMDVGCGSKTPVAFLGLKRVRQAGWEWVVYAGGTTVFGGEHYVPHHHYYIHQESETPFTYPEVSHQRNRGVPQRD